MVLRMSVFVVGLLGWLGATVNPAWAVQDDGYEPELSDTGTAVEGIQSGPTSSGSGTSAGEGGLAATGFQSSVLIVAVALVVVGALLLLITRRRRQA